MITGRRIRLTDWGRQYGLDPQSTWRMLNENRLPPHIQTEKVGRIWYVILPDDEHSLLSVGYARVSNHEQKPQLEPQVNRLWAYAGQNGILLDRVVSETASGLNDRRPQLRKLLADPRWAPYWWNTGTGWHALASAWWRPCWKPGAAAWWS